SCPENRLCPYLFGFSPCQIQHNGITAHRHNISGLVGNGLAGGHCLQTASPPAFADWTVGIYYHVAQLTAHAVMSLIYLSVYEQGCAYTPTHCNKCKIVTVGSGPKPFLPYCHNLG